MAEEKSNLEPLDEKDLDFKAKFLGVAKPKKPENVVAEVKEDAAPIPKKNIREEGERVSNLEPVGNEDLDLKSKFSGVAPPKMTPEVPQETVPAREETEFPKMAIAKKPEPISDSGPAEEKKNDPQGTFSSMSPIKTAGGDSAEVTAEAVPRQETAVEKTETAPRQEAAIEKDERHVEKADNEGAAPRITISRPAVDKNVSDDARMTDRSRDVESKVESLVRLAEMKGIPHAVKVAKHLDDNYTMDEFHDYLLADELHEALVRRGLIEES